MLLMITFFRYNPAMNNKVNVSTFNDLLSAIRKEIEEGRVILERDAYNRKTTVM